MISRVPMETTALNCQGGICTPNKYTLIEDAGTDSIAVGIFKLCKIS